MTTDQGTPDLGELAPRDHREATLVARLIHDERKWEDADAMIADLTERERVLIELAAEAGAAAVRKSVRRVIGEAATLLDADQVRRSTACPVPLARPQLPWMEAAVDHDLRNLCRTTINYLQSLEADRRWQEEHGYPAR